MGPGSHRKRCGRGGEPHERHGNAEKLDHLAQSLPELSTEFEPISGHLAAIAAPFSRFIAPRSWNFQNGALR
jgi:hypothetical protein